MPQVASDPSSVVASFSPPSPPRTSPATAPAQVTPFESMLDTTQAADDQPPPPQPAAADRDNQPDLGKPPAKAVDSKPAVRADSKTKDGKAKDTKAASSDDAKAPIKQATITAGTTNAKAIAAKLAGDGKTNSNGKTVDAKPSDGKSADAVVIASAATTAVTPVTQLDAGSAVAAVIGPAADAVALPAAALQAAPVAAAAATVTLPDLAALKTSLAKEDDTGKLQAAARKDDDAKPEVKSDTLPAADPSALVDGDGKPQATAANAGKVQLVHPHDDAPAHHADVTDATANADTAVANVSTAAQPLTAAAAAAQTAAPQAPAAPAAQAVAAVPISGVAVEIASKALAGKNRFDIRLDPPELGRIDVRLDVDKNDQVTSHLTADRADTLDLLRRDSAGLERALQDAGLKTSDNSLQFSLRDQSLSQQQDTAPTPGAAQLVLEDDTFSAAGGQRGCARYAGMGSGIDIRV